MTRRHRTIASCLAAFAFAFAQLAVSAHACVADTTKVAGEVIAHVEGCPGAPASSPDAENRSLCVEHCQYGKATLDNAAPDPMAEAPIGPALRVEPVAASLSADLPPLRRLAPLAAPPPPAILFGVLRI